MTQIDGLVYSKATVCSSKTVNFRDQNRRFTLFISQKRKTAIGTLPSRHRNKQVVKGLKMEILHCQLFRIRINTSRMIFTLFMPTIKNTSVLGLAVYV